MDFFSDPASEISLNGVTSGTGAVKAMHGAKQIDAFIQAVGVCTGGVVVFEHNTISPTYAGTWTPYDTYSFVTDPMTDSEAQKFTYPGHLAFCRHRITSAITGGGNIVTRINGLQSIT